MPQDYWPPAHLTDVWTATIERHPVEAERWQCVVHLNGQRHFEGGSYPTAKSASKATEGMLRIQKLIHYQSPPGMGFT